MKKKVIGVLSICTLLFFVSCGSTPEEEAIEPESPTDIVEDVVEETKEEISQEEVDALLANIEEAKKAAKDAGAETKRPDKWAEANIEYNAAKADNSVLKEKGAEIASLYNSIVDDIKNQEKLEQQKQEEQIAKQERIKSLLANIEKAKEKVIAAGANTYAPEEFKKLEEYVESIKDDEEVLKKVPGYYEQLLNIVNENKTKVNVESLINEAKQRAKDAGAEKYAPDLLKQLNDYVEELKKDESKYKEESTKIPGYYDSLVSIVNDIKKAEEISKAIADARTKVINAGVEKFVPEELAKVDSYVEEISSDRATLLKEGPKVVAMYDNLISLKKDKIAINRILEDIKKARMRAVAADADTYAIEELKKLDDYIELLKKDEAKLKAEGPKVPGYFNSLSKLVSERKVVDVLITNINTSRAKAIEVGADVKTPSELKLIDDYFESIRNDASAIKDRGHKVSNSYKSLVAYVGAKEAKKIIDDEKLASKAQSTYDKALVKYNKVGAAYKNIAEVPQTIIKDATDARRDFRTVITVAYKTTAKDARAQAYEEKKKADLVKAAVTQKDRYRAAVADFKKGDTLYSMQDSKAAYDYYISAKEQFESLHSDVSEEMLNALAAIESAKKNVAESSMYAEEADEMAPIMSKGLEGIEDENTVLLEEDEYEDPNASIINLSDKVEEKEEIVIEDNFEELVADEKYVEPVVEDDVIFEVEETEEITEEEQIEEVEVESKEEIVPEGTIETSQSTEIVENSETEVQIEDNTLIDTPVIEESEDTTVDNNNVEEGAEVDIEPPVIIDEVIAEDPVITEEPIDVTEDVSSSYGVSEK